VCASIVPIALSVESWLRTIDPCVAALLYPLPRHATPAVSVRRTTADVDRMRWRLRAYPSPQRSAQYASAAAADSSPGGAKVAKGRHVACAAPPRATLMQVLARRARCAARLRLRWQCSAYAYAPTADSICAPTAQSRAAVGSYAEA
jgi:hypothetical protein